MFNRSRTELSNSSPSSTLHNNKDTDSEEEADITEEEYNYNDIDGNDNNYIRNLIDVNLPQPPTVVLAPSTISTTTDNIHLNLGSDAIFNIIPSSPEYLYFQQGQQQHEYEYQHQHPYQHDCEHHQHPHFAEPDLLTLVQSYDWPQTLHRLHHHPSEATSVGVEGRTPLHIACDHDAPAFVIRAILATDELLTNNSKNSCSAITMVGTSNMNPLHIACTSPHASACVVSELLLRSRPDLPPLRRNAIVKQVTEMKDVDGDTPLHAACRCGAPIEVLALMLEANPSVVWERDYEGLTPLLRLWVRYFVILGEEVISGVEGKEDLVGDLGEAWEKTILLLRISYYESTVIDVGSVGDSSSSEDASTVGEGVGTTLNFTHNCCLCEPSDPWTCGGFPVYVSVDNLPSLESPVILPTKSTGTLVQDTQKEKEPTTLHPTTALTTMFTTATEQHHHQLIKPQPFLLIHAAIKLDCPRQVVKIATKLYPDQLHKTDSSGYTPLALAARASIFKEHDLSDEGYCIEDQIHGDDVPPISFSDYDLSSDNEHRRQQEQQSYQTTSPSVIKIILDASIEMASHPHPHTERIPLHDAILSGKTWFEGVHTILNAYPDGIMTVDLVTGLYPFMLAATVGTTSSSSSSSSSSENLRDSASTERDAMLSGDSSGGGGMIDHADTTTIFCLLRRKPESLIWASTI